MASFTLFQRAGLFIRTDEREKIEIADFGLGDFERVGLGVLVYVNTKRCCAKELAMWPGQTCPEHLHPANGAELGKEETFRCRWGSVYLYVEGDSARQVQCRPPAIGEKHYSVWHEIVLEPGGQYTIYPGTKHWFQAGSQGAVVSEFSTRSTDQNDIFTDPAIQRATRVV